MKPQNKAIIIGAGVGGLASACLLAKNGWDVTVLEKNSQLGGRTGLIEEKGFRFDSGASWYLMPDVYEHFFELMGEDINQCLKLKRLFPSFKVFYKDPSRQLDIYSNLDKDKETFDSIEPGSGARLQQYLTKMEYEYPIAKGRFMYKNYDSIRDFMTREMLTTGRKLNVLSNMDREAGKYFTSPDLQKIIEFPALFLGNRPDRTPALFGILNHALLTQGVFYPMGGMYKIVDSLAQIAKKQGAKIILNYPVTKITVEAGQVKGVIAKGQKLYADLVVSDGGLHHTETKLLEEKYRTKTQKFWDKSTVAPSALLMYLGVRGKLPALSHHNLFFSSNWQQNFDQIFPVKRSSGFPNEPSFYVCCPSKTDPTVAPKGHENLFILAPVAAGVEYAQKGLEKFARKTFITIEEGMGILGLTERIVYQKFFTPNDFKTQFNSYKGSALGLAHTLNQTAFFRPSNTNKKVKNLYYVGADTNPGIGIPPALISAELMYKRINLS